MKIRDAYSPVSSAQTAKVTGENAAVRSDGKTKPVRAEGHSDSVKVSVSDEARALHAKDQVDEAKVARLKESISNGTFKIDSQAIADKIVGSEG